jgi:membrane protease YdiL (CAAX protease family)
MINQPGKPNILKMQGLFITANPLPMRKYIIRMALLSLIPSLLFSFVLAVIGLVDETTGPNVQEGDFGLPIIAFLAIVIISPLFETLLLSLGIWILSRFLKAKVVVALLSALVWALMHSLLSPPWGLVVFWPFVVFSCGYITWRQKSWLSAVWVAFSIHALQNLLPGIVIFFSLS